MKCLIVDKMEPSLLEGLAGCGITPVYLPDLDRQGIIDKIKDVEGLIIRSKTRVDKEVIDVARSLRFVARAGAGTDNIDDRELAARNIALLNAAEANRDALGEHTIGLILALLNNIVRANNQIKEGQWLREANRGHELSELTVGIIGYGNMGSAVAERLQIFGCPIITYDKYKENITNAFVKQVSLEQLKDEADILSLHVPLTPETKDYINESFLSSFRKNIYVINTARGEILDTKALVKALREGKVIGAALDVLDNENFNNLTTGQQAALQALQASENVILTPHVGGWSFRSYRRINEVLIQKIDKMINTKA
ncbi:MAG: NAD(P)-binding domain-containing protein [Cyclobacteriaceae bacterium]|nr:NAD(P)-binding domain-containing protein [Cyclobacteriaceae bacterium]